MIILQSHDTVSIQHAIYSGDTLITDLSLISVDDDKMQLQSMRIREENKNRTHTWLHKLGKEKAANADAEQKLTNLLKNTTIKVSYMEITTSIHNPPQWLKFEHNDTNNCLIFFGAVPVRSLMETEIDLDIKVYDAKLWKKCPWYQKF